MSPVNTDVDTEYPNKYIGELGMDDATLQYVYRKTVVHLIFNSGYDWYRPTVCGDCADEDELTSDPSEVTCFECERNTDAMDLALGLLPPAMRRKVRRRW